MDLLENLPARLSEILLNYYLFLYTIGHRSWRKRRPAAQSRLRSSADGSSACFVPPWTMVVYLPVHQDYRETSATKYVSWPVGVAGVGVPAQGRRDSQFKCSPVSASAPGLRLKDETVVGRLDIQIRRESLQLSAEIRINRESV